MAYQFRDTHIDKALTNYARAYMQDEKNFIAGMVMPVLQVEKESDKYFQFDRANWRISDSLRAPGSMANEAQMPVVSNDSYNVEEHAKRTIVSDREVANADVAIEPLQSAAGDLTEQLLVERDYLCAQTVFTTTAAANSTSLATAAKWDYTSTTTPIDDIDTGVETVAKEIGKKPNTGVTGMEVWTVLKNHEDILDRIKYTQKGVVTQDLVASLLGLDNMYVGSSVRLTTNTGITSEATSYIWGKNFLVSYVNPRPSIRSQSHGYHFSTKGKNVQVRRYRSEERQGQFVEPQLFYDQKVTSTLSAYFLGNVIS
jgi:hypothetical protein